jgi:predicted acyl esterase
MLGEHGLAWPWESLHVEALAWFDHWLKNRDTGILDGPKLRFVLPGADGWHTDEQWPPVGVTQRALALCADGSLSDDEGSPGSRTLMSLGAGMDRIKASETDPPSHLAWTSEPLKYDLDMVGDIELQLDAKSTASDTAWIAILQDVDASGAITDVTAGYLRATLRQVDESCSPIGAPTLPCRTAQLVPIGETIRYRIPVVANARRFKAGHRLRLFVTSDDQSPAIPAIMGFRHASVGTSCLNTIISSSRLMLPILSRE